MHALADVSQRQDKQLNREWARRNTTTADARRFTQMKPNRAERPCGALPYRLQPLSKLQLANTVVERTLTPDFEAQVDARYLGRNPTKICFTITGTRSSRGNPLNFPSVEIETRPWSAALKVRDKRAGSPGTISPSA